MSNWQKEILTLENGNTATAQFPVIVSASRSTDIPAFYADWFFHRLKIGYSAWINPFNGVKLYVGYDNVRFIVFWSKNPRPLLQHLDYLKERNIGCYIQYTLNDYEIEGLERGVRPLAERIDTFKMLVDRLGIGSIIWRFDPMILTNDISSDVLLERVQKIGNQLQGYTEKLVFSYADIRTYKKVKHNLEVGGIQYHEWTEAQMDEFAGKLSELNQEQGWNFQLATCGEKIDISKYGICHNRCIDGDLITRLAWRDKQLMDFMKVKILDIPAPSLFGDVELPLGAIRLPENHYFVSTHKKDVGQRPFCECMASKDIGEYNTCPHLCEYCYANSTKQLAIDNWKRHQENKESETITGK